MRYLTVTSVLLLFASVATPTFGQSTNATVTGTVEDSSRAVIPGVSVSATNTATGVVTTVLSNEAGVYNVTGLLPGLYTVSAELSGFRKATFTEVTLGNAQQIRLNFTLQVAAQSQSVEVAVAVD